MKIPTLISTSALSLLLLILPPRLSAEYHTTPHRAPGTNEIAVTGPGSYDKQGTTYLVTQDISSPTSALFLGQNVVLDLNGYTITFADGGYGHVPNYGFEEGLAGWDVSRAPGAKVESDKVHVFVGKKILSLKAGDEIVSGWVELPVADRSYFAMCGVAVTGMRVSVSVESERDGAVICRQTYKDSTRICCPVENKTVRLGGGFVTAHINGRPAGKYRVHVKAETDCFIDHVDIRPAMDVGIGIVERTYPYAHTDDFFQWQRCAFFDYTVKGTDSTPVPTIPHVEGSGTIVIRNGEIRSDARGILSWGIQSTASDVHVVLENVRIVSQGINTNAVDVQSAKIRDCRFEIDTPFIINRHASEHAVVLRGKAPSEVFDSEFIGGQGCLTVRGIRSHVHDNLFINRQTVTNHYCVMAAGDSSMIYNNRIEPETGSGVEIYVHKYVEIFNNSFRITASPPTCEYGHEDYSVNAIRVADYNAAPGSPQSCAENRIYGNTFTIIGRDYPEYPDYIPMAYGVFHSVSGGNTYYYDNDFHVDQQSPGTKAEAAACYISGGNGGVWHNNRITTNIHAFWVATRYGAAVNADISANTIIKASDAPDSFAPIRMGFEGRKDAVASNIHFRSNIYRGGDFAIEKTDAGHGFDVSWTVTISVKDANGNPREDIEVAIFDAAGTEVFRGMTTSKGMTCAEVREYNVDGKTVQRHSPYTIIAGGMKQTVDVKENTTVTLTLP